jgi:RNase H
MVRWVPARERARGGRPNVANSASLLADTRNPQGVGCETFDAELVEACRALELAQNDKGESLVTVLLGSLATIKRLQLQKASSGQSLAIRTHRAAQALEGRGRRTTIQWVPGHNGIERNERADQAAKAAAAKRSSGNLYGLHQQGLHGGRQGPKTAMAYEDARKPRPSRPGTLQSPAGWKQDPALAVASKKLASRFYQLKLGHAVIGPYSCKGLGPGSRKGGRDARPLRNQSAISYWNAGNGGGLGKTWPKLYGKRGQVCPQPKTHRRNDYWEIPGLRRPF